MDWLGEKGIVSSASSLIFKGVEPEAAEAVTRDAEHCTSSFRPSMLSHLYKKNQLMTHWSTVTIVKLDRPSQL